MTAIGGMEWGVRGWCRRIVGIAAWLVEDCSANSTGAIHVGVQDVMRSGFTIVGIVVAKVVVQYEILDTLLFGAFGLLLSAHRDSETGVGGEVD